tara:strand:- start:1206 stop:1895 length:690 start_codon:yes stop_codon:yes gene_type:complete
LKSSHANYGLLNLLFTPGTGGTFLSNMLSMAIIDPWWHNYIPSSPSEIFKTTNEFVNTHNHIVMPWHPYQLHDSSKNISIIKDINWINLTITPEEAQFTKVLHAIKRQDFVNVTKEDILNNISENSNASYMHWCEQQSSMALELSKNNNVLDVRFSDIFVDGNKDVILSILNVIFKGQYVAHHIVDNISTQCIAKHLVDMHLYNELHDNMDATIDGVLSKVIIKPSIGS